MALKGICIDFTGFNLTTLISNGAPLVKLMTEEVCNEEEWLIHVSETETQAAECLVLLHVVCPDTETG